MPPTPFSLEEYAESLLPDLLPLAVFQTVTSFLLVSISALSREQSLGKSDLILLPAPFIVLWLRIWSTTENVVPVCT